MKIMSLFVFPILMMNLSVQTVKAADDIVIADFESETYAPWTTVGNAFGDGPAEGTLPGQMHVSGFTGKRLVNSFTGGDKSTGSLTSPAFVVARRYLKFLIGGGGHKGLTTMQLMVNGTVVREATGLNTQSGGSETLEPTFWDVSEFVGQSATIVILDKATDGWGHINVDEIVQSDRKPATQALERTLLVDQYYLLIPIRNGAPKVKLEVSIDGTAIRRYDTELATDPDQIDWYAFFTLRDYLGQHAALSVSRSSAEMFDLIRTSASVPAQAEYYNEPLRPQLHFSQLVGWINDPNGMTYLDGEWHLYFQHNPVGWAWGNMTWGHAVSPDLIHWEQLPNVLFPETTATGACFSGGGVIDKHNTAGWKTGANDVLVAFLTDTGAGEAVAFSNDRGRSFTWYKHNPVVKHKGRDPKVVWYAYGDADVPLNDAAGTLGGHWVMAVYDESIEHDRNIAFYTSTDLRQWELQSHLPGYFECPELFRIPLTGDADEARWVTFAADGQYAVGHFDGRTFRPDHEGKRRLHYGNFYASQTFDNPPDGRRIQMGWLRGVEFQGMPFNQPFSIPHQLTLKPTADGPRLFAAPVDEVKSLRQREYSSGPHDISTNNKVTLPVTGELFDIEATFDIGDAQRVGVDIGGNRVEYDVAAGTWNGASIPPVNGQVSVRVLLDRSVIEIWGNEGAVVISGARGQLGTVSGLDAFADGGSARLINLTAHELQSIWKK